MNLLLLSNPNDFLRIEAVQDGVVFPVPLAPHQSNVAHVGVDVLEGVVFKVKNLLLELPLDILVAFLGGAGQVPFGLHVLLVLPDFRHTAHHPHHQHRSQQGQHQERTINCYH